MVAKRDKMGDWSGLETEGVGMADKDVDAETDGAMSDGNRGVSKSEGCVTVGANNVSVDRKRKSFQRRDMT